MMMNVNELPATGNFLKKKKFDYVQELLNQVVPRKRVLKDATGKSIPNTVASNPLLVEDGVFGEETEKKMEIFRLSFNMGYPGGIGFSELLYHEHANLLNAARSLIEKCPCAFGCPSCVGPMLEVGKSAKEIVPKIIGLILGK